MQTDKSEVPMQACSYLTFNVTDWIDVFIRPAYKDIIVDTLNWYVHAKGLKIYAWCLMTNHLHLLAKGTDEYGTGYIERDFKKETEKELIAAINTSRDLRRDWLLEHFAKASLSLKKIEKYCLWQSSSHPTYIDCSQPALLLKQIEHIHSNPVRDKVVAKDEDYWYSSARDYAGEKGLVDVTVIEPMSFISNRYSS